MALQSRLLGGTPKLEAAAVSDPAHILPGATGPHVGQIQQALNKLDGANIAEDSAYGPSTAAAVRAFKEKRRILNVQGKIDDIVGKKTLAALDAEMLAQEAGGGGKLRLGFKVDGEPTIADVVVKFQGAFEEGVLTPDSVLSGRRIFVYKPMPIQPFGNAVMVNPNNGRALIRVGRKTTTIGTASLRVFAPLVLDLLRMLKALELQTGKIFIHGSSSGGRNAIDFSARLSGFGLTPHFVAAVDAAFFQADTTSRPEAFTARPTTIPAFISSAGSTPNRHNFFQTLGNHSKPTLRQGLLFQSTMAGEEIHGTVAGFQNQNLTRFMPARLLTDDEAHGECGKQGTGETERLIADELLLRT